ncbi:MAG: class I SAM-dependent methyltransferase [Alphaproteobacteria bacterium]
MTDFKAIAAGMRGVYERKATQFDRERSKILFERRWLEKFKALLSQDASILDVGCGTGEPIAQYFIAKGYDLTGVDYAQSMVAIARQRFPGQSWHVADMRALDLEEQYDGLIGWHSFFHLTPEEQRTVLPVFSSHLNPGGAMMLTVGPEKDERIGHVGGEEVYHASLSPEEYRKILEDLGFEIKDFVFGDPECGSANIILAKKKI